MNESFWELISTMGHVLAPRNVSREDVSVFNGGKNNRKDDLSLFYQVARGQKT